MRDSDFEEFHPFRWLFFAGLFLFVAYILSVMFGLAALPFRAVSSATTIVTRIMDPDNALAQYRWFHDADARLKVFPAQIKAARANLAYAEKNAPERAQSRMTELTGITQVCEGLVADYNSRAQRLDAGFFRNPERWLPVATAPWEPLPQGYSPNHCEGQTP